MTTFVRTAYHQQKMLELEKEITRLRQRVAELDGLHKEERADRLRLQDRLLTAEQRVAELERENAQCRNTEALKHNLDVRSKTIKP